MRAKTFTNLDNREKLPSCAKTLFNYPKTQMKNQTANRKAITQIILPTNSKRSSLSLMMSLKFFIISVIV